VDQILVEHESQFSPELKGEAVLMVLEGKRTIASWLASSDSVSTPALGIGKGEVRTQCLGRRS
jgi:hypothetical protein